MSPPSMASTPTPAPSRPLLPDLGALWSLLHPRSASREGHPPPTAWLDTPTHLQQLRDALAHVTTALDAQLERLSTGPPPPSETESEMETPTPTPTPTPRAASMGKEKDQSRDLSRSDPNPYPNPNPDSDSVPLTTSKPRKARGGEIDFASYRTRSVAFQVLYVGWKYRGVAHLRHYDDTVEYHLFDALRRCRLVPMEATPDEFGYARCGRTDRGVSATGQVVSLRVRSNAKPGGVDATLPSPEDELDYATMINRSLPADIRVIGWAPVRKSSLHSRWISSTHLSIYLSIHPFPLPLPLPLPSSDWPLLL